MATPRNILLTVVFTTLLAYSYQLQCYECYEGNALTRAAGQPCGNFSEDLVATCATKAEVCTKVDTNKGGVSYSIHSCGTTEAFCEKQNIVAETPDALNVECFSCSGDKCNGASSVAAATSLLAVAAMLVSLLPRHF